MKIFTYVYRDDDGNLCLSDDGCETYLGPEDIANIIDEHTLLCEFLQMKFQMEGYRELTLAFDMFKTVCKKSARSYESKQNEISNKIISDEKRKTKKSVRKKTT